jgi:hypothetical protein
VDAEPPVEALGRDPFHNVRRDLYRPGTSRAYVSSMSQSSPENPAQGRQFPVEHAPLEIAPRPEVFDADFFLGLFGRC